MRAVTLALGGALSWIGRWLAWPGETLGNAGIWVANLYCPCHLCRDSDTHPEDGDVKQAPLVSGAGGEAVSPKHGSAGQTRRGMMDGGNSRKPVESDDEAARVVSWASSAAKENGLHGVASELDFAHAYLTRAQPVPADVVERVARAIENAITQHPTIEWDAHASELAENEFRDLASAAISAMGVSDEVVRIAEFLIDQRDEPWPKGTNADRLHYWRDKAIEAAERLQALAHKEGNEQDT